MQQGKVVSQPQRVNQTLSVFLGSIRPNHSVSSSVSAFYKLQSATPFSSQFLTQDAARTLRNLWAPPPPTFGDRRATAADNLSARRRCHVGVFSYFVALFR